VLEVREASKTFNRGTSNEINALMDINLTLRNAGFLVVVGTNGSGKSTLLNAIAGTFLLDAGWIDLDGRDISREPEHRRAALMGRVFQNPFTGTAPGMTVAENLIIATRRGLPQTLGWALPSRVRTSLRDRIHGLNMGLEDRLDQPMGTLSGGQRQALTLLMATWRRPRLLLLDEHTAALDPRTAEKVIQLTDEIVRRDGLTTLMVTHSMEQAVHLGDRLIMMHQGRVIHDFEGPEKERLRSNDLLDRFDEVRRMDRLDESAAEMLARLYV